MENSTSKPATRYALLSARSCLAIGLSLFFSACNSPPLYGTRAEAYLSKQGVSASTILKLVEITPLNAEEVALLNGFDDVATLHLLGSNPSTPREILARLAQHPVQDVRWGAATNSNTPMELVLKLRTPGKYSTTNGYVARNPALPQEIIREMFRAKETGWANIAMNKACPVDLMREIIERGTETDRSWLAWNRNLPTEIMQRLANDPSPDVARMLAGNPAYLKWKKTQQTGQSVQQETSR